MTLHQLKIFEAVAEHLNITKVSRKLQVSQPSVSKQLRLLEQEYGLKFYVKSGRGIKLTQEGQLFQVTVKPILEQMEGLKRTFENRVAEGRAKSLIVGSSPSPAAFFLFCRAEIVCGTPPYCPPHAANRVPSRHKRDDSQCRG
jgi:DNA-binding transcriptional LysR family regulator